MSLLTTFLFACFDISSQSSGKDTTRVATLITCPITRRTWWSVWFNVLSINFLELADKTSFAAYQRAPRALCRTLQPVQYSLLLHANNASARACTYFTATSSFERNRGRSKSKTCSTSRYRLNSGLISCKPRTYRKFTVRTGEGIARPVHQTTRVMLGT